jgi:hypothetical protein
MTIDEYGEPREMDDCSEAMWFVVRDAGILDIWCS